jgi:hypothetical protein
MKNIVCGRRNRYRQKISENGKKKLLHKQLFVFVLNFELSLLKEQLNILFTLNILFAPKYFLSHFFLCVRDRC